MNETNPWEHVHPREGNIPWDQFSHLQFHNPQPPNFDLQRQNPLWFLRWPHCFRFGAVAKQTKGMHSHFGKKTQVLPQAEQHLVSEQDTAYFFSWATRPDRGSRKGQNGKTKDFCVNVAARGILSTLVTAKGTLHPSKASAPGPTIHQLVGHAVLLTTNAQPWAKGS